MGEVMTDKIDAKKVRACLQYLSDGGSPWTYKSLLEDVAKAWLTLHDGKLELEQLSLAESVMDKIKTLARMA